MSAELYLRKTVIAGETAPGDFLVIADELVVGRIHRQVGVGGAFTWSWSCALPNVPQRSSHRGRADTLEAAKAAFRTAWSELEQNISHAELAEARRRQAKPGGS